MELAKQIFEFYGVEGITSYSHCNTEIKVTNWSSVSTRKRDKKYGKLLMI